ncbi:hypothetical protein FRB98_009643 [Tulasnella sp. 332]|nr:hypothetical protein FRB98_009643 [Tulasnella sp. 332]
MAWFSSFFDTVQCEAEQPLHHDEAHTSKLDSADKHNEKSEPNEAAASENEAASKSNEEEKEEKAEGGDAEEEEEPEPEDSPGSFITELYQHEALIIAKLFISSFLSLAVIDSPYDALC